MTLRKLHNNIVNFRQPNVSPANRKISSISYDDEPLHPKQMLNNTKFWNNAQKDIEDMNQKARQNLKKYQMKKLQTLIHHNNKSKRQLQQKINPQISLFVPQQTKFSIPVNTYEKSSNYPIVLKRSLIDSSKSLSSALPLRKSKELNISAVRTLEKKQKERETFLKNRLQFIEIDQARERQQMAHTRQKCDKVLSTRSSSFRQKQSLAQRQLNNIENDYRVKKASVQLIKAQKSHKDLSLSKFKEDKNLSASMVRQQNKANASQINNKRQAELLKKQQNVKLAQSSSQTSKSRISSVAKSFVSSIRSIENKRLMRNYLDIEKREKQNEKLYRTLQREIKLINQRKLKAASEKKLYEGVLGTSGHKNKTKEKGLLEFPNNKKSNFQKGSNSKQRSFYLTIF